MLRGEQHTAEVVGEQLTYMRGVPNERMPDSPHLSVLPVVEPVFKTTVTSGLPTRKVRILCPDCWLKVNVRIWRPEAGSWYLQLQELLAAGRTWNFRYDAEVWQPTL